MSRSSQGSPLPPQWHEPARSQEHPAYGPSRLREHPRRTLFARKPQGNHPTPQGGGEGPTLVHAQWGSKPHITHGKGAILPLSVPCHRAIEVGAANPYRHIGDRPEKDETPRGSSHEERAPLGVPDPVYRLPP